MLREAVEGLSTSRSNVYLRNIESYRLRSFGISESIYEDFHRLLKSHQSIVIAYTKIISSKGSFSLRRTI